MNKVYMHYQEKQVWVKKALIVIFCSLALWGFYKNGFVYFHQGNMSFITSLRPLVFPLIGIICCEIGQFLKSPKASQWSEGIFEGMLLGLLMPPQMNILLFTILVISYVIIKLFIKKKVSIISSVLFFKVVSIIFCHCFFIIDYQNVIEASRPYLYGIVDTFFGRSVGCLGTTSIFLLLIFFFIKSNDYYYKKELPLYIVGSYSLFVLGYIILLKQSNLLLSLLNSHVYFMAIILTLNPRTSPVQKHYLLIYGVLLGFFCFITQMVFHFSDGIYISLFFMQGCYAFLNYLNQKRLANNNS